MKLKKRLKNIGPKAFLNWLQQQTYSRGQAAARWMEDAVKICPMSEPKRKRLLRHYSEGKPSEFKKYIQTIRLS